MLTIIFVAMMCMLLRTADAVIDPGKLEFAYFVTSSFARNPDDVFKDQSVNHHDLVPYGGNMYPMYDDQAEFVDFSSNPNDGMKADSMIDWNWPKEWGFSVWFRRDSLTDNPKAETDQVIMGNMSPRHVGSFDLYIKASKTAGSPATMGFAWTTKENSTAPSVRQKFAGLLCPEGVWHNFVMTGNGGYVNVWLDNEAVFFEIDRTFAQVAFGNMTSSHLPLNVGGGQDGLLPFQGEVKNIVFYNQFLGMLDVNTLYRTAAVSTYAPTFEPSAAPTGSPTKAPTFGREFVIASYFTEDSFEAPYRKYPTALDMLYRDTSGNNHTDGAGINQDATWAITAHPHVATGGVDPPIASSIKKVCEFT